LCQNSQGNVKNITDKLLDIAYTLDMTYKDIQNILNGMSNTDLNKTATVFLRGNNEYIPVLCLEYTKDSDESSDVLDDQHPIITID
jgi:hypothetical protein